MKDRLSIIRPGLSFACPADRAQRIDRGDPADRAGGEAGLENFPVWPDGESGRVNDAAAFLPIGADFVRVIRYLVGRNRSETSRRCARPSLAPFPADRPKGR